jgi:hypothetical protein
LQRFDCGFVLEPGLGKHFCDPAEFGKAMRTAKAVAVRPGNFAPGTDAEGLSRYAVDLIRGWGRFKLTEDTDAADLVFQFNMYSRPFQTDPITQKEQLRKQPLPACSIWVWPRGADPEKE